MLESSSHHRRLSGPQAEASRGGFVLIATVSMVVLLVVVTLGVLSLSTTQIRQSRLGKYEQEARANARLGLVLALGELQKQVGPDQRVTATAALLDADAESPEVDGVKHPHWTGVWSTTLEDGPVWVRDDSDGGLTDRRVGSNWEREKEVLAYLVSGNEGGRREEAEGLIDARTAEGSDEKDFMAGEVELVGEGSLGADAELLAQGRVVVPKVRLETGARQQGHYGYWVGDLGVRANIATKNGHEYAVGKKADYQMLASQEANAELMTGPLRTIGIELKEEEKGLLVSRQQLDLLSGDTKEWRRDLFHDVTVDSMGVLSNTRDGGLKRDLSAYLQSDGTIQPLAGRPETGLSDDDRLVGPRNELAALAEGVEWNKTRHRDSAPRFGALRHWAGIGKEAHTPASVVDAVLPKPEPSPRFPKLGEDFANVNLSPATIADFDKTSMAPILVEGSYMTSWSRFDATDDPISAEEGRFGNWQLRAHLFPRVVLWNPFGVSLKFPKSIVMVQGNGRKEMHVAVEGRGFRFVKQYHVLLSSRGEVIRNSQDWLAAYNTPYAGNVYFTVPETVFGPGECLVFSCAKARRYDKENLLNNMLSAEVAPDPSKNFYSGGSDVSATLSLPPPMEWWEQPVTGNTRARNQADDSQMLLKVVGGLSRVNYEDFDTMPLVAQVSCSLQYGGGREPRIQWNSRRPVRIEETKWVYEDGPLTLAPDVRSRDGFRMRWFWETQSNEENSGELKDTPHLQSALAANWNLRAGYTIRTPWENLGGTMPQGGNNLAWDHFGGGPWFFGAYTRDLFDEAVGFVEQAPVLRDGRYHGNPFGQPQDFATYQDRYVLFDVPHPELGVLSMGQFQHSKISEFVWHPSYAVGQSLVDPRVGFTRTAPKIEEGGHGWDAEAVGWSSDRLRSKGKDEWASFGRGILQDYATDDHLVYDLSYEVNHSLWDGLFLSTGTKAKKEAFMRDPFENPLPSGRHVLSETTRDTVSIDAITDYFRSAFHLMVDGSFNVNSISVDAWKAMLGANRGRHDGSEFTTPFPRVLDSPEGEWQDGLADDASAWAGYRVLNDDELERLAKEIVKQVKLRGPFLSLSDFVNRRLVDDETGRMGPLQAAIEAAGLNAAFESGQEFALDNRYSLPDYRHPDNIEDATRLEQTLKPSSKAWGAPGYLTQGDLLQVVGPALSARSDTFVIRSYGDAVDDLGTVRARAWCEAVVQRSPEPLFPDESGLDSRDAGTENDFGRKFVVTSFRWLNPDEI